MYSKTRKSLKLTLFLTLLQSAMLLIHTHAMANPVQGRYLNTSGGNVILQLNIGSPAPQNLILEQYLPAGTKVLSTTPRARKIDQQSGVVKWLFKRISPGQMNISMTVSPDRSSQSVQGAIRYRAQNGNMIETRVSQ